MINLRNQAHQNTLVAGLEEDGDGIWIPPRISLWLPWTGLSDFHQSARRGKECKCKQTLKKKGAKGSDVFSSVIYANQHFTSTFLMHIIIKFQRCSSKLSFLFLPHCPSAPESLLAGYNMLHRWLTKEVDKIELFLTILCLTDTALQFS